ncbi:MAG: NAD(P)-binding domain-containing protein [Rhodobacteraceae bacterium]|nr:NAD(P)-binding domain-containing protein [Paracoccaceae bacterium]
MPKIPYITAADVDHLLDWNTLTDVLLQGHRAARAQISDQFLTRGADTLLSRAAWVDGMGVAVKSVTVMPGNAARGLPSVQGAMLLFDDQTGAVEAVIDSALVTKWKTAGDSLLGAKLLARPDAARLLIVGAGTVAGTLIEAYSAGFPGIDIEVWNRSADKAVALAAQYQVRAVTDLPAAVGKADIISCATMARKPVVLGDWLQAGQHLDLIGAFKADMRETDDTALQRSKIFVDSRETTLDHIGELKTPLAEGIIQRSDILGDFYDLAAGQAGREADFDITLFKNGGGAHLDLMTGQMILKAWRKSVA